MKSEPSLRTMLVGVGRLARFDARGLQSFGGTRTAFWQSFQLLAVAVPMQILFLIVRAPLVLPMEGDGSTVPSPLSGTHLVWLCLVEGAALAVGWAAYPLVMVYVSDWLGAGARYYRYMIAYNWVQLALLVLQIPLFVLVRVGVLPVNFVLLVLFGVSIVYPAFVARHGLNVNWINVAGIVFLDFLLTSFISGLVTLLTKSMI